MPATETDPHTLDFTRATVEQATTWEIDCSPGDGVRYRLRVTQEEDGRYIVEWHGADAVWRADAGVGSPVRRLSGDGWVPALAARTYTIGLILDAHVRGRQEPTRDELAAHVERLREALANPRPSPDPQHHAAVFGLCERVGYGVVMVTAAALWREKLAHKGMAGGEFYVGPCVGGVERLLAATPEASLAAHDREVAARALEEVRDAIKARTPAHACDEDVCACGLASARAAAIREEGS